MSISTGFAVLGVLAVLACPAVPARQGALTGSHRVGILGVGFNAEVSLAVGTPRREALRAALRDLGLREAENLSFVERLDDGSHPAQAMEILAKAAGELVEQRVELIIAAGSAEALVAERTTTTIPIVFWSAEPIAEGLVTNLERPGGNATGIIPRADAYTTRLEMLNALLPGAAPIGYLFNPTYGPGVGTLEQTRRAASAVSVSLDVVQVNNLAEFDAAFARFAADGVRAVLVGNHGLFRRESRRLVELSMQRRIPLVSPYPEARDAGALVSFVPDFEFWSRRAAVYVGRILAGAKAGELPVEQSVPNRLTLNLTTAAALGIDMPDWIIRRMDRVIH